MLTRFSFAVQHPSLSRREENLQVKRQLFLSLSLSLSFSVASFFFGLFFPFFSSLAVPDVPWSPFVGSAGEKVEKETKQNGRSQWSARLYLPRRSEHTKKILLFSFGTKEKRTRAANERTCSILRLYRWKCIWRDSASCSSSSSSTSSSASSSCSSSLFFLSFLLCVRFIGRLLCFDAFFFHHG